MGAPFVARGFAGEQNHLKELIKEAILFKGTALVDILQPCVSFNKINTYPWYRERVFMLEKPLTDRYEALKMADLWGEKIPIGVIYRNEEAECREEKKIFREQVRKEEITAQLNMKCIIMR
jgi:2-oxoglutarate ferredoxin oxidoreductase subunit beta